MKNLNEIFRKILECTDPEKLNDFLISLSKNPKDIPSDLLEFILKNLDSTMLAKIKINFIFLLGEIGKTKKLEEKFYAYLVDSYFDSDRWIRDEIVQAFINISNNSPPNERLLDLLSFAINEDYAPLKNKALDLLGSIGKIPLDILLKLFKNLDSNDSLVVDKIISIFKKNIKSEKGLFEFLNFSENYKKLNSSMIRTLLINYIHSVNNLSEFRGIIQNSLWEDLYKNKIINETKVYEKILLKRL